MQENKWVFRFLAMAQLVGSWSKDPSTKVGSLIAKEKRIVSVGFNGFPSGTKDDGEIYEDRERKYLRVIHGEVNAIMFAKKDLTDHQLYATHFPCCQCAALIIQSGISEIYVPTQSKDFMDRWYDHIKESLRMFNEAGVRPFVCDLEEGTYSRFCAYDTNTTEIY